MRIVRGKWPQEQHSGQRGRYLFIPGQMPLSLFSSVSQKLKSLKKKVIAYLGSSSQVRVTRTLVQRAL